MIRNCLILTERDIKDSVKKRPSSLQSDDFNLSKSLWLKFSIIIFINRKGRIYMLKEKTRDRKHQLALEIIDGVSFCSRFNTPPYKTYIEV